MLFNLRIYIDRDEYVGFWRSFPIQGFISVFTSSDLLIWINLQKDVSTPLTSTSAAYGLDQGGFIGVFSNSIFANICVKKSELSQ